MAIFGLQSGAYRVPSSVLARRRFLFYCTHCFESHPSDSACTHSAAFLRCHGRLLCRTDHEHMFCYHCRYAVSLQYPENSFNRNTCKSDSIPKNDKEALCDLFHAPPIINFSRSFRLHRRIFREKNPVDRIRNRTDLFSFLYRAFKSSGKNVFSGISVSFRRAGSERAGSSAGLVSGKAGAAFTCSIPSVNTNLLLQSALGSSYGPARHDTYTIPARSL